jgi:squalene cyclase
MYKKLILLFLIINIILAPTLIISTNNSFTVLFSASVATAAAKEQEITSEDILSKISLATQWLIKQQRPDGSWPIVTQDKRSSVVATGLFGLGTFNQTSLSPPNIKKALSFLLSQQHNEGYWEATSSFNWNKVEATTAALYGLISAGYKGKTLEKGMDWLIKNQKTNGSWNDDCWDTCWALYLLLYFGCQIPNHIIESASFWLVNDQRDDGSWKTNLPNLKQFEPLWTTPPVIFALAQIGKHQNTIIKGLRYLKNEQNKNGSFGRKDASKTGLALLAFSSLSKYPDLIEEYKPSAERAVHWFLSNQRRSGTWPGGFHPFNVIDTAFSIWGLQKYFNIFLF